MKTLNEVVRDLGERINKTPAGKDDDILALIDELIERTKEPPAKVHPTGEDIMGSR